MTTGQHRMTLKNWLVSIGTTFLVLFCTWVASAIADLKEYKASHDVFASERAASITREYEDIRVRLTRIEDKIDIIQRGGK